MELEEMKSNTDTNIEEPQNQKVLPSLYLADNDNDFTIENKYINDISDLIVPIVFIEDSPLTTVKFVKKDTAKLRNLVGNRKTSTLYNIATDDEPFIFKIPKGTVAYTFKNIENEVLAFTFGYKTNITKGRDTLKLRSREVELAEPIAETKVNVPCYIFIEVTGHLNIVKIEDGKEDTKTEKNKNNDDVINTYKTIPIVEYLNGNVSKSFEIVDISAPNYIQILDSGDNKIASTSPITLLNRNFKFGNDIRIISSVVINEKEETSKALESLIDNTTLTYDKEVTDLLTDEDFNKVPLEKEDSIEIVDKDVSKIPLEKEQSKSDIDIFLNEDINLESKGFDLLSGKKKSFGKYDCFDKTRPSAYIDFICDKSNVKRGISRYEYYKFYKGKDLSVEYVTFNDFVFNANLNKDRLLKNVNQDLYIHIMVNHYKPDLPYIDVMTKETSNPLVVAAAAKAFGCTIGFPMLVVRPVFVSLNEVQNFVSKYYNKKDSRFGLNYTIETILQNGGKVTGLENLKK